eukprot:TRINITY_DN14787_c0_g1_i1.p1 TRINITY_DN14787_c0_g1~~TRINITY_DN14787_c0_g1_i1.p1  ORF type:complete len:167 (+),score=37.44 TRINITY_DN14787_c0_g1_i1:179-679(+)
MGLFSKKKKENGKSGSSGGASPGIQPSEFQGQTLEYILNNETLAKRIRPFIKQQQASSTDPYCKDGHAYNDLLFLDQVRKRENVFTSGKRCGDDDFQLEDKMRSSGSDMLEKYLRGGAENQLKGVEEGCGIAALVDNCDKAIGEMGCFSEIKAIVAERFHSFLEEL